LGVKTVFKFIPNNLCTLFHQGFLASLDGETWLVWTETSMYYFYIANKWWKYETNAKCISVAILVL